MSCNEPLQNVKSSSTIALGLIRESTRRLAITHFRNAIATNHPFDIVFCTSDSMTLGCLDAIAEITNWQQCPRPRLFGYDGIPATRRLAGTPGCDLERVVVQDTHDIAVAAVEQLLGLLKGEDIRGAEWIEPVLYPGLPGVQAPLAPNKSAGAVGAAVIESAAAQRWPLARNQYRR
jgi:ABC-type sugar transport system substrate-binding protein